MTGERAGRGIRTNLAMTAVAAVAAIAFVILRERSPAGQGLGWDGVLYASVAERFLPGIVEHTFTIREIHRCLPQALVHLVARATGTALTRASILDISVGLNAICIVATAVVWGRIADRLDLRAPARWVGFAAQLLTFGVLSWAGYVPVQTDAPALLLSACAVLAWLRRSTALLALVSAAAAFTWPTWTLVCLPLLAFPRAGDCATAAPDAEASPPSARPFPWAVLVLAFCCVASAGAWLAWRSSTGALRDLWGAVRPWKEWFPVSVTVCAAFFALAAAQLARVAPRLDRGLLRRASWAGVGAGAAVFAAAKILPRVLCNGASGYVGGSGFFLELSFFRGFARPGVSLAAHALWLGPLFAWTVLAWPRVVATAARWGPAPLAVLGLASWFALTSESRHLLFFVPLGAALLAASLDGLAPWRAAAFVALGLASSGLGVDLVSDVVRTETATAPVRVDGEYPRVLSWIGPWMSERAMLLGFAALVTGAAMFPWRRRAQ